MNIDMKDTITLDDKNQYVVASKINYENKIYYYLVDIHNHANLKFCYEDKDELVELNDKELTTKLLPLFFEKAVAEMSDILGPLQEGTETE